MLWLAKHQGKFEWIDKIELDYNPYALKLIKEWPKGIQSFVHQLSDFRGLNTETARAWLDTWYQTGHFMYHLDSFTWLDKKILQKLGKISGWFLYVTEQQIDGFKAFTWLDKKTAMILLDNNSFEPDRLVNNLDKFEGIDEEVAERLIRRWWWDYVAKHPEKFWLKKEK